MRFLSTNKQPYAGDMQIIVRIGPVTVRFINRLLFIL